jgi:hypothetical protein
MPSGTITPWRWDQGRLAYSAFDSVRLTAKALVSLENISLQGGADLLQVPLSNFTQLAFPAGPNSVWRNYKRTFGSCLLATEVQGRLICTELAHKLCLTGKRELSSDEYFGYFIKRFYHPSPVFKGYSTSATQLFPGCALLRFLLGRLLQGKEPRASIEEILSFLVGNQSRGDESIAYYQRLLPSSHSFTESHARQVREFIIHLSQLTILKWDAPYVYLDVEASEQTKDQVLSLATPSQRPRKGTSEQELLHLGETGDIGVVALPMTSIDLSDNFIREGGRKSVTHVRIERSSRLRKFLFSKIEPPFCCDICTSRLDLTYPWTTNLLEVHHLLPLSSPLRVDSTMTSLEDLVPLCPNCHKATHSYYTQWLKKKRRDDFVSRKEAKSIYGEAKTSYRSN